MSKSEKYTVIVYPYGTICWYQNEVLHRLDGPACEYKDGSKRWYIEGVRLTEEEFNETVRRSVMNKFNGKTKAELETRAKDLTEPKERKSSFWDIWKF